MKTVCHICQLKMDNAFDNCPQCGTSLTDTRAESVILSVVADQHETLEELGVNVTLILTNNRVLMVNAEKEESSGPVRGGIGGAFIHGAIEGYKAAVDGKALKLRAVTSVQLTDIASLNVEESGFLKRFRQFTIADKGGKVYYVAFGKKTAPEWESEIRRRIV